MSKAKSPDEYISELSDDRAVVISKLRNIINENLPKGFQETMSYGMIGWVVPHSTFPDGYHCDPSLPLPFINVASQKNFVALYHMGIYAKEELMNWFVAEYPKYVKTKLDMGKSCIRFKKMENIPYDLIAELVKKITCEEWVGTYNTKIRK